MEGRESTESAPGIVSFPVVHNSAVPLNRHVGVKRRRSAKDSLKLRPGERAPGTKVKKTVTLSRELSFIVVVVVVIEEEGIARPSDTRV